jgi:hypothetical protein
MNLNQRRRSESIYLGDTRAVGFDGLTRIASYWGEIAIGYVMQGRSPEAGSAASHSAHYGHLALDHQPPQPSVRERWAA